MTTTAVRPDEAGGGAERRLLQRLVLPLDATVDIIPLYVEQSTALGARAMTSVSSQMGQAVSSEDDREHSATEGSSAEAARAHRVVDSGELTARHSAQVPAGQMRSFGTYFNAFPAAYWRRWTPVREVRLSIRASGSGQIVINRSNARGAIRRHTHHVLTGPDTVEDVVLDLPLTTFGDGGWYWFDVYAGEDPVVITSAEWTAPAAEARTRGTISLAMTTLNKVDYALDNIAQIAGSADLREHLDVMYVVDQGSDRLVDHTERLGPLQETLGDQLEIIEQGNIGGSGGFSRGMYESARAERSTYVVNCDDDIVIEPESLIRMLTFADYARTPTLVGAHMFDLNDRSVLYTYGESVDLWRFLWGPTVPGAEYGHDFASRPLRSTPWLHRRVDADYNGWWMCLIPLEVVREIGLSLPVFIKWDDSEYGLRAKRAGFPTVSLPGAGVWHMSWADKDDAVDWQAYFHERNRLIAALLHSPYERGGAVVRDSEAIDVKHLLSMQYGAVSARLLAQRDVLAGPGSLHREIGSKLPEVRKLIRATPDGVTASEVTDFPAVSVEKPLRRGRKNVRAPHRALLPLWAVKNVTRQLLAPVPGRSRQHPQQEVAHGEATWWNLAGFDSALVSTADGSAVSWYHRDPARFRSLLGQVLRTHAALTRHWPRLAREYRAAAGDLASFEAWERTFEDAR